MGIMATTVRDTGRQHLRWMRGLRCALMSNPYMASYVKRAYTPCPVYFLAFLTLLPWTRE
jgi:hypothetical protein